MRWLTLRQHQSELTTGPFGTVLAASDYFPGGIPLINPTHIRDGRFFPDSNIAVDELTARQLARHRLRSGDLVVGRHGDVGRSALVREAESGWLCGGGSIAIRCGRTLEPRFLQWFMSSSSARGQLLAASKGATMDTINEPILMGMRVPTPPLAEQRAIADYLDAETARIDVLIAKKKQLIHLLDERVAALVDIHFSPNGPESTVRLARLATVQTGVTLNAAKVNAGETVRLPYLRVANVQPGWLDLSEVREVEVDLAAAARSLLQPGDVLMTEGGDIDKLGRGTVWRDEIENCLHQNHVFAVRPHPKKLDSDFLANVTRTSHARAYFESTGVQSTNLASTNSFKVADFRIGALDIDQQRACCDSYDRSARTLTEASSKLGRQFDLLAEHRQALITAAVTGEFAVPGAA